MLMSSLPYISLFVHLIRPKYPKITELLLTSGIYKQDVLGRSNRLLSFDATQTA
jgi:hypothetical protein